MVDSIGVMEWRIKENYRGITTNGMKKRPSVNLPKVSLLLNKPTINHSVSDREPAVRGHHNYMN